MHDYWGAFWRWFTTPWHLPGNILIQPLGIVEFVLILVFLWWGAIWLRRLTRRTLTRSLGAATAYAISRLTYYVVIALGILIALQTVGVNLSSLSILGGVVGVGLGFGLQNIFSNFASGLILLFEHSIKVGDYIQIKENGLHGEVKRLSVRYTQVMTNDHVDILVPNSQFVNGEVINWSLDDAVMRVHIPFRVPYGTDREKLRELVVSTARAQPLCVSNDRYQPSLWINAFGEAGYECEMIVWVDKEGLMRPGNTRATFNWALAEALEKAGIEIPRPRQEVVLAPSAASAFAEAANPLSSSSSAT
ncbi:mechanosensitive ion channel protein MscS [Acidithiobacillus marinus]|uniref:Mechanosensitive ion channel protein MscS n=1 Tax=Acidithiobacillus marinus TaxID=187490 RepID=A0A2I1DPT6_9PROT|nr:mechanosensitive ion channel domain-containing protein [Acidithiobacillus marinus]PKY11886.1 mechanosensitive ion channel protein MscS [Acidithiobacillus marinus]